MYNNIFLIIIIILILYVSQWDIYIKKKINRLFVNTDIKLTTDISTLKKTQKYIDNILIKSVNDDFNNTGMLEICQTVTKGGKRVRGILMLEVFNILNKKYSANLIDDAVIFIEYIQASSLIFDDIVDGDVSRRGEKCVHVTHGIGVAQLVGLSLVSKAFHRLTNIMEKIERATHDDKIFRRSTKLWINMIKNIHKNTNILIQGQYIDITTTATITNNADMFDIINFKTASLFELCYIIPYILVNIDADKNDDDIRNEIEGAKRIGRLFGIIFQISDDFEDYYDDISNMNNGAVNYVCNNGRDKAVSDYYKLVDIYTDVCTDHKIFTNNTKIIINYLNEKVDKYSEIIK